MIPCYDFDPATLCERTEITHEWQTGTRNSELHSFVYFDNSDTAILVQTKREIISGNLLMRELFGLRPEASDAAFINCLSFFVEYLQSHDSICKPLDIVENGNGGITIAWKHNEKYCEIIFPKLEAPYLYFSFGPSYGVQEPLTVQILIDRLTWLEGTGD